MPATVEVRIDQAALRRIADDPRGSVGRDMLRRARRVEAQARRLSPFKTGRLRGSIHLRGPERSRTGVAYDVVAATDYAIYVHDGTRFMAGRPFLTDALRAAVD